MLRDAFRCPECRSLRVDFPQFTEKSIFTNIAFGLMAELGLIEREYYCHDCHCMWARPAAKAGRARSHMAPDYFLDLSPSLRLHSEAAQRRVSPARARRRLKLYRRTDCLAAVNRARAHPPARWNIKFTLVALTLGLLAPGCSFLYAEEPALAQPRKKVALDDLRAVKLAISPPRQAQVAPETPTYLRDVLPIFMGKCARCHNEQTRMLQNWLEYRVAADDRWEIKRRVWDSWHGVYFKQPMPTGNSPESQAITDEERDTIRKWVESGALYGVRPAFTAPQSRAERIEAGKRLFATVCAACHQPTGQGLPARFPPLAGSDFLNADKHRAIGVVVNGLQGEITVNGQKFNNSMPKFPLSDEDIASALTYVYNSFGNSGKEVTPQDVSAVRAQGEISSSNQAAKAPEEKSPFE